MEFRILGPVDVLDDAGVRVTVGGARERALLALLVLNVNRVVSTERLVDDVWGTRPTDGSVHALRVHISRLRRVLRQAASKDVLLTRPHGYVLHVEASHVDAARFEALLSRSREHAAADDHSAAARALRDALAEWRGPALADVVNAPSISAHAVRLDETRLGAVEQRLSHDLACGRHTELVGELEQLTTTHPLREGLWGARMIALYRSERQAEALGAYQTLRTLLHDQLGLEPSSALSRLHDSVLHHDPQLDWPPTAPGERAVASTSVVAAAERSPSVAERRTAGAPAQGPPPTRYAKNGDVSLAYQVVGDGPVDLVLVPGFVSHLDLAWENPGWQQIFQRLTVGRRLILWDKRGTGLSDPVHRIPTLDERVGDLLAVLDAAGSSRTTLLGVSEGGPMSLLFAAAHPERAHRLILYGVSPRCSQAQDWPWGWSRATVAAILAELEQDWGEGALLTLFAPSVASQDTVRRGWGRTQRAGASPQMALAVMKAMIAFDCRDLLPAVATPTLLLHRRGDRVAHIEAARYMARNIPGARLVEFPGDNHLITAGDIIPILNEVDSFLAGPTSPDVELVLATVLTMRCAGSTGAAPGSNPADPADVPKAVHQVFHAECARFGGHELPGADGAPTLVASFPSPSRAVSCAVAVRDAASKLNLALCAGVHTSECDVLDDRLSGPAIQISSDLASLASPAEVVVTSTVKNLGTVTTNLTFTPRADHQLGEAAGEYTVYSVLR